MHMIDILAQKSILHKGYGYPPPTIYYIYQLLSQTRHQNRGYHLLKSFIVKEKQIKKSA